MPSVYANLRRRYPYLTPPFAGDDEQRDMMHRIRLPRGLESLPMPGDDNDNELRDLLLRRRVTQPQVVESEPEAIPPLHRGAVPMPAMQAEAPPVDFRLPTTVDTDAAPEPIRRRNGRPYQPYFGHDDPTDRATAYRRELESYQPQRESKKHILARAALAFIGGGIPAAALTAGEGLLNRRGQDREWQQDELAKLDKQVGRLQLNRRQGMQDELLQAQVNRVRNPLPGEPDLVEIPDPVNPSRNIFVPKKPGLTYEPRVKPPTLRRMAPVKQVDEAGNEYLADAKTGEPLLDAKGGLRYTGRAKPANVADNSNIERSIAEAENEKRALGPSPPTEVDDIAMDRGQPVVRGKKVNPAYLDWAKRYRELDDQIRTWRQKLKAPKLRGRYSGQRISRAKLPEAAKRLKMSEAAAEAFLAKEGATIY